MNRKCIWLALLAIAFTTGCSQMTNGSPRVAVNEPASITGLSNPATDSEATDSQATDSEKMRPADAGEQNPPIPTADQETDPETANAQLPSGSTEIGETTPMADPQTGPETVTGQLPADSPGQSQTTSAANPQTGPETATGQPPIDSGEQYEATPAANQQIASMLTSNPMWVPGPAPYDLESNERSYVIAGLNLAEGAEVIPASSPNPFQAYSVTRLYGVLNLVKKVRRYNTALTYKGGGNFVWNYGSGWSDRDVQALTLSETISWPNTKLNLQDSPNYFPGASFGSSAFGGASSYTLGLGGTSTTSDFFGFDDFSGINGVEHFTNVALAQLSHALSERSSISFAGADAITNYFGGGSINSQQISGLAGYTYATTARSSVSASYGFQELKFIGGANTEANTVQLNYSRSMSERITLALGGGPQFIISHTPEVLTIGPVPIPFVVTSHQTGLSGEASLGYGLRNGSLGLTYEHLLTSGSGLFAGATSDIFSLSATRAIWQAWTTNVSGGFVRLSNNIGSQSSGILGNSYQYWFAGLGVGHRLGRSFNFVASYQFDHNTVTSACSPSSGCGGTVHLAQVSITWRTRPFRLDRGNFRDVEVQNPGTNSLNPQVTLP